MAQVLFKDKIPTLTESGGTITMPSGARLTIGGQQYVTTSALNVSADLSSANTRYQIFAVESGGAASLVVSSNENSVGPAGATAWKLVGSYYTDGLSTVGFGSFVNISGTPFTKNSIAILMAPRNNVTSITDEVNSGYLWERRGNMIFIDYSLNISGTSAGTNFLEIFAPENLSFDRDLISRQIGGGGTVGAGWYTGMTGIAVTQGNCQAYLNSSDNIFIGYENSSNAIIQNQLTASSEINQKLFFPIPNFSTTPIEDL